MDYHSRLIESGKIIKNKISPFHLADQVVVEPRVDQMSIDQLEWFIDTYEDIIALEHGADFLVWFNHQREQHPTATSSESFFTNTKKDQFKVTFNATKKIMVVSHA